MKTLGFSRFALGLAALLAAVAACSSDDKESSSGEDMDHTSPYPTCNAIIEACHPHDIGEGAIHDCHDHAHEAHSDADCVPLKDMCFATCAATADTGADGGGDAAAP